MYVDRFTKAKSLSANCYQYPKLRWPIEIRIETFQNEEILLISCPLGVSEKPLALVPAVAPILQLFEGQLSIDEILAKFAPYGIQRELLNQLVEMLDQNLYLATPRFFAAEKEIREKFTAAKVRPAALAGYGYSADPGELERQIDKFLEVSKLDLNGQGQPLPPQNSYGAMQGLVSPHIDYHRGGICYGITYANLRNQAHDLFVLIGTAHQFSNHMFHLTPKDFSSPLGTLECDLEMVTKISQAYGLERSFADEFLHRREHSLELQLPFLQRLNPKAKIVPILVGSFYQMVRADRKPNNYDEYESFVSALTAALKVRLEQGQKICFVAGVDMAHVGRAFGDEGGLNEDFMLEIDRRDREYMIYISSADLTGLFSHIAQDQDRRRICGFPTMYTVIDCMTRLGLNYTAEIFDYRQAVNYSSDCTVTFAGM
ncbi:MAG: AmmeMemoRadiSam system protein B, partial [Proteobacteria bacterium]